MKTEKYLDLVHDKKGQFVKVGWIREMATAALYRESHRIEKETFTTARTGIDYDSIRSVKEARENGSKPAKNAGLSWGEWKEFPWVIEHKGNDYARIYSAPGAKPLVKYYLNGLRVDRATILPYLTPSDAKKEIELDNSCNECFVVKMNDLEAVAT